MSASPPTALTGRRVLQAVDRESDLGGGAAAVTPQGDAEADQGDAGRDRHGPIERLWQHRERRGGGSAHGEQWGGPPVQDASSEQRDAEEEAPTTYAKPEIMKKVCIPPMLLVGVPPKAATTTLFT